MEQFEKTLKSQIQKVLFEQFIRYDKQKNIVSFSPTLIKMATDKAKNSFGSNLQTLDLKSEGKALNFSLLFKNGTHISASIEPEALELGPEEIVIVGKLPHGLNIEGINIRKTVSGFFDNLFGTSPAASLASATALRASSSLNVTDILKNFSVEGNTFRLKRPLKLSILGRALSSTMVNNSDRTINSRSSMNQRLALSMEEGWLNLNLGDFNFEKVFLQFASEALAKHLLRKEPNE
ncbi:MAG: hypothetical protein HQM08_07515 [Candidatus Riflebacteria bacterium]|nr:hypothetical protein [Candidatus Riflebacteria bacterium]